jgi:VIT1/CCC1 family predicted Fe2+/Mn2+ transporter
MSQPIESHNMSDTPAFENIQLRTISKPGADIIESQPSPTFSKLGKSRFTVSPLVGNNVVLGVTDGLTVPFALTAGLTALGTPKYVILAGLAEVVSGSISMGLSTYLCTKSNMDSYRAKERVCDILLESPDDTDKIVRKSLQNMYRLTEKTASKVASELHETPSALKEFLMTNKFEATGVERYEAIIAGVSCGLGYLVGGFIPIIPYFAVGQHEVLEGLYWSIGIMGVVLVLFGYVKTCAVRGWGGKENVKAGLRGAAEMVVVGAAAAGLSVALIHAINSAVN